MNQNTESIPFRVGDFFDRHSYYWQTRQWHFLRLGLPAVIVGFVVLMPILLAHMAIDDSASRYRVAFNRAVAYQEYETAYLFRRKLEAISTGSFDDAEFRFNCAMVDIGRGQLNQGVAILSELAPADSFGYGPAHLWLAKQQIAEDPSMSGSNGERIVHHLQGALIGDPNNHSVHLALGHYYHRSGNQAKAVEHLSVAVENQPQLHFVLAGLQESLGNEDSSQEHYEAATETMTGILSDDPDNLETRINLSVAFNKVGDFNQAVRTLVEGLEFSDDETRKAEIIKLLSALYLTESDRLRKNVLPDSPQYAKSLMLLSKALEFAHRTKLPSTESPKSPR